MVSGEKEVCETQQVQVCHKVLFSNDYQGDISNDDSKSKVELIYFQLHS